MTDNPKKRGKADASKIAMHQDHEVRYWTKKLGLDKVGLGNVIDTVGHGVKNVRKWLAEHIAP